MAITDWDSRFMNRVFGAPCFGKHPNGYHTVRRGPESIPVNVTNVWLPISHELSDKVKPPLTKTRDVDANNLVNSMVYRGLLNINYY
jgi:hypothetical protein